MAHIEITSGPQAGTYDATGPKVDCNASPRGVGASYQDLEKTAGLTRMTFGSIEAGANPTKFDFQALFGDLMGANASGPEISTLTPESTRGSGTATVEDRGSTIKVTLDGTGHDGARLKATIECGPVTRG